MTPALPQLIAQAAAKYRISPAVLSGLVRQESGGNQGARSPVGAIGLTQLMPGTARGLGVDPYNAQQNLEGGAHYLREQLDAFHSLPLALAAYNAGPGAVQKYHGVPPYSQTQNYVKSILGALGDKDLAGSLVGSPAVGAGPSGNPGLPPGQDPRRAFASALLAAIGSTGQLDNNGLVGALQARQQASNGAPVSVAPGGAAGTPPAGGPSLTPDPRGSGGILELLREGTGGPTHSTGPHIHAAFGNPQLELAAIAWAQQHGLTVRENPYVGDTVDRVHAKDSYHYRTFPGLYNGRKLGEAVDVSGPNMGGFYQWLASRR